MYEELCKDFKKMFTEGIATDVTVNVVSESQNLHVFQVHKFVLISRSPVFAAMFRNSMKESESSKIEISHSNVASFGQFIEFMYSGSLDKQVYDKMDLVQLADRYEVPSLLEYLFDKKLEFTTEECLKCLSFCLNKDSFSRAKQVCVASFTIGKDDVLANVKASVDLVLFVLSAVTIHPNAKTDAFVFFLVKNWYQKLKTEGQTVGDVDLQKIVDIMSFGSIPIQIILTHVMPSGIIPADRILTDLAKKGRIKDR